MIDSRAMVSIEAKNTDNPAGSRREEAAAENAKKGETHRSRQTTENMEKLFEMWQKYHSGVEGEREEAQLYFIKQYEPWAYKIIHKGWMSNCHDPGDIEDLKQAAMIGILTALEGYDPTKGSFRNYSRGFILKELTKDAESRMPVTVEGPENIQTVRKTIRKYEALQINPTPQLIARDTGLSVEVVSKAIRYMYSSNLVDLPRYMSDNDSEDMTDGWETVPSRMACWMPEENLEKKTEHEALYEAMKSLPYQELWAIILRYGMNGDKRKTYGEIAEYLSVKTSQIKPLIERGIQRIRQQDKFSEEFRDRLGGGLYREVSVDGVNNMSNEEMERNINGIIEAFNLGMAIVG